MLNDEFLKLSRLNNEKKDDKEEITGIKLVLGYLGIFLLVIGAFTLLPLIMLIFFPKEGTKFYAFLIPGLIALAIGFPFLFLFYNKKQGKLTIAEDMLLLLSIWLLAIIFAAIPYFFYGYSFTQGIFEATSGYTTTGLTILNWDKECVGNNFNGLNHILYFHRSLNQLIGGVGLVLIVSSAISSKSGLNLYRLEGHNDRLMPNLIKSARTIFMIYFLYILIGSVLYIIVGVNPFDALCNSIAAVSTGGFSTRANGIYDIVNEVSKVAQWRGIVVEIITEILMLLGGTNFMLHYSLFSGKIKNWRHFEFTALFILILFTYPLFVSGMTNYYGGDIGSGFRYGTFEFITCISTTGFQSIDSYRGHMINVSGQNTFMPLPSYIPILMIILLSIGMQQGSTSGGIKDSRLYLIFRDIINRLKRAVNVPEKKSVNTTYKYGVKSKIEQEEISEAETYSFAYILIILVGSLILAIAGNVLKLKDISGNLYSPVDYIFEFSSSLAGCGLTYGITSFNTNPFILWVEMFGMMLGRLEIFIYFNFIGTTYNRLKNKKHTFKAKAEAEELEF